MAEIKSNPITKFLSSKFIWIGVIILGVILIVTLKYNKHEKIEYKDIITIQKDTVFYYKDKYDIEHARVQTLEASINSISLAYGSKIDSITKELSINKKQIQSIIEITSETIGKIKTGVKVTGTETDKYYSFEYDDKYLKLDGIVNKDTAEINYTMTDNIRVVGYQKRSGFLGLGRKKAYADIKSDNPKVRIKDATSIKLDAIKEKSFSIGPSVGYYFDGTRWKPGVGVSLQWRLIKF